MKNKTSFRVFFYISFFVFLSVTFALGAAKHIPLSLDGAMKYVVKHTPPVFDSVKLVPDLPVAGEEIQIHAIVQSSLELKKVLFHYRAAGEAEWREIEFEQDVDNEKLWVAVLPPQSEGAVIEYRLSAKNEEGDRTIELSKSKTPVTWPPAEGSGIPELALVSEQYEESQIPKDLDIKSFSFAYDDSHFYFQCEVTGGFSTGWVGGLDNMFVHAYALGMLHGFEPFAVYYAPFAAQAGYPGHTFVKAVGGKPAFDDKVFESKMLNHSMYVKLSRDALGTDNKLELYRFVFLTGALLSAQPFRGELEDISAFVHVYLREPHSFTVQKAAGTAEESSETTGMPKTETTENAPSDLTPTPASNETTPVETK